MMSNPNNYDEYASSLAYMLHNGLQKSHALIEKPAMYSLLPDLQGKDVLSAGCGTGAEIRELTERGANVHGFDLSAKSVELARTAFQGANLRVLDMHDTGKAYEKEEFDLIYSSLTLHYSEHLDSVLDQFHGILKPGGILQFSVMHPVKWSAESTRDPADENNKAFLLGYNTSEDPPRVFGNYLITHKVTQKPQNNPEIAYWSRSMSTYHRLIRQSGFQILDFIEPLPIPETKELDPKYWLIHSRIPQFMIFVAQKIN